VVITQGYKQTEVGAIPKDWDVATLGSITTLLTNGFVGTATSAYVDGEDGVLYIQGYNVLENGFDFHGIKRVSRAFHSRNQKSCLQPGDLLTIQTGDIGVTASVPPDLAGANCHALVISRFRKTVSDPHYYSQYFNSERGRTAFKKIETGTTMKHLNCGDMKDLLLPSPPLAEQQAIAAALNDMDALLDGLERLIAKKRDLKQAAMQQLLTGQTRLPGFRGEWQVQTFDETLIRLNVKVNQIQTSDYQASGAFPVVDQGKDMIAAYSDGAEKLFKCPADGVIVFGDHTCIVKFIDFDFLVGADGTQIVRGRGAQDTRFHAFQLQYRGIESTGYNRHFKFLKERGYLVPQHSEQVAIATFLSDMGSELSALEARLDKIRNLKQAMLQELLIGRTRLV
jgi:type I restriction enzyme S subunit